MAEMADLFGDEESPQSKGGKARRERLDPERRVEIAKTAAAARWSKPVDVNGLPKVLCGSAERPMRIASLNLEIPCYVIEGERRVFSQRGIIGALDIKRGGAAGGGDRLTTLISGERIKPFVSTELLSAMTDPVRFQMPNGLVAFGYDAEALHGVCLAILAVRRDGKLFQRQAHIAERCEQLIAAWSLAGVISAVDEATGYQYVRAKDAIEKIIDKWLVKELQPWKKQFPLEYYKRIFELNEWNFDPNSTKRPGVVGHWTNDIVYDRIGPGLKKQLHDYAGRDHKGRLKHHLTGFLTSGHGIPELKSHLDGVVVVMKLSSNWAQFMEMLQRAFPKPETTISMALDDLDKIKKKNTKSKKPA